MPRKLVERPAPRIIEPPRANMPRYYEWDSESSPGRKHRTTVFNGEVKGCTCRGAKHGCWHQEYAARVEWAMKHESQGTVESAADIKRRANMTEETPTTAVALREPTHEVAHYEPRGLTMTSDKFDLMWKMAQTAYSAGAGMLPDNIKTPEAAMAVMMAGAELGFEPFAALRQVFIVNGKTQIMSEGLYALMKDRDPSLDVEWHQRDATGAEATLWRRGREVIRIRYDESDRQRAHQGQKRGGPRKWIPVYDADGRSQKKHPAGHAKAGEGIVRMNPDFNENAAGAWEDDPSSPWQGYPTDMFSWAVLKRLQRFGAPELVSLSPQWGPGGDEAAPMTIAPRSQLSQAVVEGTVSIGAASEGTEVPELEGNPDVPPEETVEPEVLDGAVIEHEETQQEPESAEVVVDAAPAATSVEPDDVPLWQTWDATALQAQRQKLHDRLVRQKTTMAPNDYGRMARGIAKDYGGGGLEIATFDAEQTYEAINRTVEAEGGDVSLYWGE